MTGKTKTAKGRPKQNGEILKPFTITAKPSELERWKQAAESEQRALSAWVRIVLNREIERAQNAKQAVAAVSAGASNGDAGRG